MTHRHRALIFALLIFGLVATACTSTSQEAASPLILAPPWGAGDQFRYALFENEKEVGKGVLRASRSGAETRLVQEFTSSDGSDISTVVVDSESLKPKSSERNVTGKNAQTITATYNDDSVTIATESDGKTKTRELRIPGNAYDNDSSLFIWRSLPFEEEYRARYTSVIPIDGGRSAVIVRVLRRETVNGPGGLVEAWRVLIDAGRSRQTAWYSTTPDHQLLRYDNGRTTFVLEQ